MDLQQILPIVVPKAIAWAKQQEAIIVQTGSKLSDEGIAIAQRVGVLHPTQVRACVVAAIPLPEDPVLAQIAVERGIFGPRTGGVTLGYGIYLVDGKWDDQLMTHELRHVHQYESLGGVDGFMPVYLSQIARYGYGQAPLERDARAAAGESD